MKKVTLYVVAHKFVENKIPERTIIGVGNNYKNVDVCDNTGINISEKNNNFCELTALYWIWKNDDSDIVGLEHYRRQFEKKKQILDKNTIFSILSCYDIIVPHKCNLVQSLYHNYCKEHEESDLVIVEEIIKEKYTGYIEDFEYLKKTNKMYVCNMFIAKKSIVDAYCEWLFTILFELEQRVDLSKRSEYQMRMFGFLSERLFNVYLHHNHFLKIKEIPICEPENGYFLTQKFSMKREIKYYIKRLINYENMYR